MSVRLPTGSLPRIAPRCCAGVTTRTASQTERSSRLVVAWIAEFRLLPSRKPRLQWVSILARPTSSSNAQLRTCYPTPHAPWAQDVPNDHAPNPPILLLSHPPPCPFPRPHTTANTAAPPP